MADIAGAFLASGRDRPGHRILALVFAQVLPTRCGGPGSGDVFRRDWDR